MQPRHTAKEPLISGVDITFDIQPDLSVRETLAFTFESAVQEKFLNYTLNQTREPEEETEQPKYDYKTNETKSTESSRNSSEDSRREYDLHEERNETYGLSNISNSTTSQRSHDEKD